MSRAQPLADSLYERLANEEDARVCKDISEDACRVVPGNFFRIATGLVLTKTGDALINPKTVLAWLVQLLGAPAAVLGLLVPIRESGSMLPQLVIAAHVRRRPVRKYVWVLGGLVQAAAVAAMGGIALTLDGIAAGILILGALVVFSLARGLCSVSSKDLLGKCIPKTRRGLLGGMAAGVAGVLVAGLGAWAGFARPGEMGRLFYAFVFFAAAALWLLASVSFGALREEPGATEGGGNAAEEAWRSLALLRTDAVFRRFVLTRALMMSTALVAPYYVALAQRSTGGDTAMLGLLVLAGGIASAVSAPIWGRMADRSSRRVLVLSAFLAAGLGALLFVLVQSLGDVPHWGHALLFLVLMIAHAGVRLGRKTYLVDMAGGNKRTDYVAVSNTVIGVLLLVGGAITAALSVLGAVWLVLLLSITALLGGLLGLSLPEVE